MRGKKRFCLAILLLVLFILFTLGIKLIDVRNVGPLNSKVGFATINQIFFNQFGVSSFWYKVTEVLGLFPLLLVIYFALRGFGQLISRKSIFLIDKKILLLGFLYAGVAVLYVLFEKIVINFRPILIAGNLEASYPSSHTFLAITVLLSSFHVFQKEAGATKKVLSYVCLIGMLVLVFGRFFSGAHWLTDILGGVLLGLPLVQIYLAGLEKIEQR